MSLLNKDMLYKMHDSKCTTLVPNKDPGLGQRKDRSQISEFSDPPSLGGCSERHRHEMHSHTRVYTHIHTHPHTYTSLRTIHSHIHISNVAHSILSSVAVLGLDIFST